MLYVSASDSKNTFTAHATLMSDMSPDGSRFLPFRIPEYIDSDATALKGKSFNQIMAEVLNLFFSARLTGWDIDFCVGKATCKNVPMNHKLVVSELWHNADASFKPAAVNLNNRLLKDQAPSAPSSWLQTAVNISALFAVYGQMINEETAFPGNAFDIVVPAGDMTWPIAAIIAGRMGLPLGTIILSCSDAGSIWDLIHKGTLVTAGVEDEILLGVEAMISLILGNVEALAFCECRKKKKTYSVTCDNLFSGNFYCTVAGKGRSTNAINSLYRSNNYIIDPLSSLCFAGLQDYRSGTGFGCTALIISEVFPAKYSKEISSATGISEQRLTELVKI